MFPNVFLQVNGKMENIMGKVHILAFPVLGLSLRNQVTFFLLFFGESIILQNYLFPMFFLNGTSRRMERWDSKCQIYPCAREHKQTFFFFFLRW